MGSLTFNANFANSVATDVNVALLINLNIQYSNFKSLFDFPEKATDVSSNEMEWLDFKSYIFPQI